MSGAHRPRKETNTYKRVFVGAFPILKHVNWPRPRYLSHICAYQSNEAVTLRNKVVGGQNSQVWPVADAERFRGTCIHVDIELRHSK